MRPAGRSAVMPVDSPTVANAEITSKATWSKPKSVSASIRKVATATSPMPNSAMASAWRWFVAGTRRRPTSTSGSPRISAHST